LRHGRFNAELKEDGVIVEFGVDDETNVGSASNHTCPPATVFVLREFSLGRRAVRHYNFLLVINVGLRSQSLAYPTL